MSIQGHGGRVRGIVSVSVKCTTPPMLLLSLTLRDSMEIAEGAEGSESGHDCSTRLRLFLLVLVL